jgi:hypothetical protein
VEPGKPFLTYDAVPAELARRRSEQDSRSWLYNQPDLRAEIERLRARRSGTAPGLPSVPDRQRASNASLLRRLESATERIRCLEAENRQLRDALAVALGAFGGFPRHYTRGLLKLII